MTNKYAILSSELKKKNPRSKTVDFLLMYSKSVSYLRLKKTNKKFRVHLN